MAYIDELRELHDQVADRMEACENDTAYAALVRQLRAIKADIQALESQDEADDLDEIIGEVERVR